MDDPTRAISSVGAAGVGGGNNRPGADAGDAVKRNAVALERHQHAGVSDAARETSAERQSDSRLDPLPRRLSQLRLMTERRKRSRSSRHKNPGRKAASQNRGIANFRSVQ
jgi:hypothetical protein